MIEVDETTPQGLRRLEQFKTFAVECNTLLACVESISYCIPEIHSESCDISRVKPMRLLVAGWPSSYGPHVNERDFVEHY